MMTIHVQPGYSWFAINSLGFASLNDKDLAAMLEDYKLEIQLLLMSLLFKFLKHGHHDMKCKPRT